jgi:uncharacterized protein
MVFNRGMAVVEQHYVNYWRSRQAQQRQQHQCLAGQARQDVDLLVQLYRVQRIILFGSLARDRFAAASDIDLAVEGLPSAPYFEILAQVNQLTSRWVDLKRWEDLDPRFQSRILDTGEVIYAREQLQ